jgi:hypothetical protein
MTVWIYINTAKEVGDVDHLKVFASEEAAERWFAEHDLSAFGGNPDTPFQGRHDRFCHWPSLKVSNSDQTTAAPCAFLPPAKEELGT